MGSSLLSAAEFRISHYNVRVREIDKPWYLRLFNDTHAFALLHARDNWNRWKERSKRLLLETGGQVLFMGLADYIEFISDTERKTLARAGLDGLHYDMESKLCQIWIDQANLFADGVSFMAGHSIGLLEGNHHTVLRLPREDGEGEVRMTSTQYLCERLNCPYLGAMCFVQITFEWEDKSCPVRIFACHHSGGGGGYLLGSQLNMIQRKLLQAWADIYLEAHTHRIACAVNTALRLEEIDGQLEVVAFDQILMRTGGMLKSVKKNKPGYIPKRGKGTVPLRLGTITMTPRFGDSRRRGFYVELEGII